MRKVITTLTFFWILFTQCKYCKFIQKIPISQKSFKNSYCELHITIVLPAENTYIEWFHRPTQKSMSSRKHTRAFSAIIPIDLSTADSLQAAYLGLVALHTMGWHVSSPTNKYLYQTRANLNGGWWKVSIRMKSPDSELWCWEVFFSALKTQYRAQLLQETARFPLKSPVISAPPPPL